MKKEYVQYAKRLNTLGDLIIEISNLIGSNENEGLQDSFARYEYASKELQEVKEPNVISDLHVKLNDTFAVWIYVTKALSVATNENDVQKLIEVQSSVAKKISVLADEIFNRFQNN